MATTEPITCSQCGTTSKLYPVGWLQLDQHPDASAWVPLIHERGPYAFCSWVCLIGFAANRNWESLSRNGRY